MKKLIIAMAVAQMALGVAAAPVANRDSAIKACLKTFPDAASPVDDKMRTFAQDDRINLEFNYMGAKLVCSVGKTSAEVEEASVMGRKFSKADLKSSQEKRQSNEQAVGQIAGGNWKSFVANAKISTSKKLQNPQSARFKDLFISNVDEQPTLCGKLMARMKPVPIPAIALSIRMLPVRWWPQRLAKARCSRRWWMSSAALNSQTLSNVKIERYGSD